MRPTLTSSVFLLLTAVGGCERSKTSSGSVAQVSPGATEVKPGSRESPRTVPAPAGCFYETELRGWSQVETNNGDSLEQRISPGVAMGVETISVCRNGSAAFLRGADDKTKFAVRFVRANQDPFQALLQRRFALESEVSFRTEAHPPVMMFDEGGQVTVQWQERNATIVGERELYVPTNPE